MPDRCQGCGREKKRPGQRCSACYQALYRQDPERYATHKKQVANYQRKNPAKRKEWVNAYRIRVGQLVPDLQELRRAIKNLDRAVVEAEISTGVRSTGEFGSDEGTEP